MTSSEAQEGLVELYCREIKLPGLRRSFRATVREAEATGQPYLSFLLACLAQEAESRRHSALENRLRQARFPWVKNLNDFDFSLLPGLAKPKVLALGEGTFIKARENVVCIGPTGTGKSHIAIGVNALQPVTGSGSCRRCSYPRSFYRPRPRCDYRRSYGPMTGLTW